MTYQPVLPMSGIAGWRFLQRTLDTQQKAFNDGALMKREIAYFTANIGKADTPEKLLADPQLLKVALGAFGLGEEAYKKAFIRKALEGGTEDSSSFANRLVDRRYRDFAAAFAYGNTGGPRVGDPKLVADVVARYRVRSFEEAVGAVDESMRLALNFEREAPALAASAVADRTKWLRVLGDLPMREVMQGALGLPKEFAQLDLDKQVEMIGAKFNRVFGGDVSKLSEAETREKVVRRYLAVEQAKQGPSLTTPGATALILLQNSGLGASASANLLFSRF